ncbi:uncharacterized protein LOC132758891 isoform X1 [Ruditapes philippinarum]|uniref:uncharacterized protein LOC132758891 isoform X1 n=1 Tax=Ruditapes philippinarum TaxID=129788 RepID=UPI00295BEEFF|nr:uncharacterized protein LOC132758891 isoform X1 [Ruditapes philippinarum]XP_060606582.1 uncharacterized protein LOC132758891 isoform X1 [Ruditapes philippinarum]
MVPVDALNPSDLPTTRKTHNVLDQMDFTSTSRTNQTQSEFSLPTPIQVTSLSFYLENYFEDKKTFLLDGFKYGFALGSEGQLPPKSCQNHPSVALHETFVQSKLTSEISKKRIKGPYPFPPFHNLICSPLGVVPKRSPNSFRLIHDLSHPKNGTSVNSTIPESKSHVQLEMFDHVASLVLKSGQHSLIAKADIEDAFRIIPISPLDYHKLGFSFQNKYYFDTVLPMGASSSVAIFESFSKSIQWILQHKFAVSKVSHIIDDFIFVGSPNTHECQESLDKFMHLASLVGIPVKHDKTVLPATSVEVHGIVINTTTLSAHLPSLKITNLKRILGQSMQKKKVTLHELQSILGHLNFACKVIKPGRCFLRRLYDLTKGHTNGSHFIKLSKDCRADLKLWYTFLENYNGVTLLTNDRFISSKTLRLYSDAAGSKGFACTHQNSWTFGEFPETVKTLHINILELFPIALAVVMFGKYWANKNILFVCDNLAAVHCLNKQTSKDSIMMKLIRIIVLKALDCNFCFHATHISSKDNLICDKLSRLQVAEALKLAPHLDDHPTPIPINMSPRRLLK